MAVAGVVSGVRSRWNNGGRVDAAEWLPDRVGRGSTCAILSGTTRRAARGGRSHRGCGRSLGAAAGGALAAIAVPDGLPGRRPSWEYAWQSRVRGLLLRPRCSGGAGSPGPRSGCCRSVRVGRRCGRRDRGGRRRSEPSSIGRSSVGDPTTSDLRRFVMQDPRFRAAQIGFEPHGYPEHGSDWPGVV